MQLQSKDGYPFSFEVMSEKKDLLTLHCVNFIAVDSNKIIFFIFISYIPLCFSEVQVQKKNAYVYMLNISM